MKILSAKQLDEAAKLLQEGKVIAFPTETVYGLGVIFDDKAAYDKLVAVKRRPPEKPFTLMLADINNIEKYADLNKVAKALAKNLVMYFVKSPDRSDDKINVVDVAKGALGIK